MIFEIWYPNLTIKIYAISPMTLFFKFKHIISNSYTDNTLFKTRRDMAGFRPIRLERVPYDRISEGIT